VQRPLLAQSRHPNRAQPCPLLGVKRTSARPEMSDTGTVEQRRFAETEIEESSSRGSKAITNREHRTGNFFTNFLAERVILRIYYCRNVGEKEKSRDTHFLLAVPRPCAPDPVLRSPATRARIAREQIWNTPPEILPILFPDRESARCRNTIAESPQRLSNSIPSV
jgi:hypothetical protein